MRSDQTIRRGGSVEFSIIGTLGCFLIMAIIAVNYSLNGPIDINQHVMEMKLMKQIIWDEN